jgi:hypothetical protein
LLWLTDYSENFIFSVWQLDTEQPSMRKLCKPEQPSMRKLR